MNNEDLSHAFPLLKEAEDEINGEGIVLDFFGAEINEEEDVLYEISDAELLRYYEGPPLERFLLYRYLMGHWVGHTTSNSTSQFGIRLEFRYLADCSMNTGVTIIKYEEKMSGGCDDEACGYIIVQPIGIKAAVATSRGQVEYQVVTRGKRSLVFQADIVCGNIFPYIKRSFRVVDRLLHYEIEYRSQGGITRVHQKAILERVPL